jgi:hypothetical protein
MWRICRILLVGASAWLVGCGVGRQPTPPTSAAATGVPDPGAPTPAVPKSPAELARDTAKENLKRIGLAVANYDAAMGALPVGIYEKGGGVGLSWRVQVLPYLEQENLYRQFKQDEPWDSEHNKKWIEKMPDVFASPGKPAEPGHTHLRSFVGSSVIVPSNPPSLGPNSGGMHVRVRKLMTIKDGSSNTLYAAEAAEPVIWTKPDELPYKGGPYNQVATLPKLGGVFDGGFHGLMADGQAYFFPADAVPEDLLRALLTVDCAEPVDLGAIRKANGLPERQPAPPRTTAPTGPTPAPPSYTGPKK